MPVLEIGSAGHLTEPSEVRSNAGRVQPGEHCPRARGRRKCRRGAVPRLALRRAIRTSASRTLRYTADRGLDCLATLGRPGPASLAGMIHLRVQVL